MSDRWRCPACGAQGPSLASVFRFLRRHPTDPAKDRVECLTCYTEANRYDGLIPKEETC